MNQKDWIEYFEEINGRKPTPQEFAVAREAGEFVSDSPNAQQSVLTEKPTQVNQQSMAQSVNVSDQQITQTTTPTFAYTTAPKKKFTKKTKTIVFSILGVVVTILLLVGWRYQSGKIASGVYEVVGYEYYDENNDKWVDEKKFADKYGELLDFVVVDGNSYQYNRFSKSRYNSFSPVNPVYYELNTYTYSLSPWSRHAKLKLTLSEYKDAAKKFQKVFTLYDDQDIDNITNNYKEELQKSVSYEKKGNQFIEKTYNKKGKLILKVTYKLMTSEAADKRLKDYDKAVEKDKSGLEENSDD